VVESPPSVARRLAEVMIDEGWTNGTWLNDRPGRINPATPSALCDGDRITLGYWTVIVVRYEGGVTP
jgi:hypothetical protein